MELPQIKITDSRVIFKLICRKYVNKKVIFDGKKFDSKEDTEALT